MAATSLDSPKSALIKDGTAIGASPSPSSSSPLFSPSSDKRFWSTLRGRMDMLLESRETKLPSGSGPVLPTQISVGSSERAKRLKEDSMLLLRGFDSVANTLSQLSDNIDNALQGARDLAKPPTLTDIYHSNLRNTESTTDAVKEHVKEDEQGAKFLKRKFDSSSCHDDQHDDSGKEVARGQKMAKMTRAKNLAISMATKAASLARELKSMKSVLNFVQERCALLEEENRRIRDGLSNGIQPEEDDLVRLQLETLLAEKSRLANENANLIRENQCLNQLVTYHQLNSQDLSASYEEFIHGMCLDFSSPTSPIAEDDEERALRGSSPKDIFGISASLDELFEQEQQQQHAEQSQAG
ncbi:hypothetical protein CDL15_Pgr018443 [Punica granatum]|uniref:Uncharacterized protein n=1 Tax=Punica granatum TaxID=22663 RepID=A0A218WYR8_PUNGR|nr:hypothetical protein CDL15_Pgr018443 [Punica granatum]PKI60567.1 hypothetical protein CRG98_019043 [Punica granatum]